MGPVPDVQTPHICHCIFHTMGKLFQISTEWLAKAWLVLPAHTGYASAASAVLLHIFHIKWFLTYTVVLTWFIYPLVI